MTAKMTSGEDWSLSPASEVKPPKKENPRSPEPKLRLEKRAGKQVTVIAGLHTYGAERLNAIAKELKTTCGAGGTVKNGNIEIQGDKVSPIRSWLNNKMGPGRGLTQKN